MLGEARWLVQGHTEGWRGSWDLNLGPELQLHQHKTGLASGTIGLFCAPRSEQTQAGSLSRPHPPLLFSCLPLGVCMGWARRKRRRTGKGSEDFGAGRPGFRSPHFSLDCVTKHQSLPSLIVSVLVCQMLTLLNVFHSHLTSGSGKGSKAVVPGPTTQPCALPAFLASVLSGVWAGSVTADSRWTVGAGAQASKDRGH